MSDLSINELKERVALLENEVETLKQVEDKFQALFDYSPIGIAYHNMVYDESGKPIDFFYISANQKFKEFTGQDPTGRLVTEVFPGIEKDENFDWIGTCGKVARTGEPVRFQQHLPPVDRWYDIQVFQDKPDHFVVSFLEITEQRKTEMALQQRSKLDAIGQLAGGIAHDFNNMLGGITGAAELLGDFLPDEQEPKEYQDLILNSAAKAAIMTQQLLTFSCHYDPVIKAVDVHQVIQDTILLLKNTIDRRIEIRLELTAETSVVIGDSSQLQSAVLNLGINSAQAMVNGGILTVATERVVFDLTYCETSTFNIQPGTYLKIEIRDTGCGIPAENLNRVFDPFFTTKEQGKGTGLGLSMVYGSVSKHNGAVSVYSDLGQGASFHVYLPLVNMEAANKVDTASVIEGSGRVLVVDDEEVMRVTSKAILQDLGYDVVMAENGQQALDIIRDAEEPFDLVLLDMIMPVMNGLDCFLALKKMLPDLPVVICSGFSREEDLQALKGNRPNGILKKPYLRADLSQVVYNALLK